jgi:hypothetical protein
MMMIALSTFATLCGADDAAPRPLPSAGGAPPTRPRQATPVPPPASQEAAAAEQSSAGSPKFVAESKWLTAGYNNNEIVYQVFVTNQDEHIIRCTTEVRGFYIDSGKKLSISDRQITTVMPNQPTQVGNWMDLDQASGANYSIKCHTV